MVLGSILSIVGVSILFTYWGVYITRAEELLGLVLGILTGFIWADGRDAYKVFLRIF